MVIGIDIREAREQKSGKSRYTYHVVMTMVKANSDVSFVLYGREKNEDFEKFKNVECVNIEKRGMFWHTAVAREWQGRVLGEQKRGSERTRKSIRRAAARIREDEKGMAVEPFIYFSPTSFIVPFLLPKKYKSVVTVHDLIAFKEKTHQKKAALIEKVFAGRALRKAAKILVPSHNTAKDLAVLFPYTKEKIVVTPLGVDESFFIKSKVEKTATTPREKIILTVGGLEPRKNISTLVDAFLTLDEKFAEYKLVLIGGNGWNSQQLIKKINQHAHRISHLTHISGTELPEYYRRATLFVFPSLYEGFGLPPLEAMACETPVVCSNASSLPEVCGVSALLCNPVSVADMREKMTILLHDESLRTTLAQSGLEHAEKFTWERCAAQSIEAIRMAQ